MLGGRLLVSSGYIWLKGGIVPIRAVVEGLLGMLRLSGAIIQRVIRGLEIRGWRRCVFVEITSRTRDGRVCGRVAGRSRGAHEQFLILEASVGARSVGSCAIAMLLRSAIERIPMGMVIALTEAWVPT